MSSSRSTLRPGLPRSTANSDMPSRSRSGSVLANVRNTSARSPLVTNTFSPLSTKSSPSAVAPIRIASTSLPPLASVRQNAPRLRPCASGSRKRRRWSPLPKRCSSRAASPVEAVSSSAVEACARASSSCTLAKPSSPVPAPPDRGERAHRRGRAPPSAPRGAAGCALSAPSPPRADGSRAPRSRAPSCAAPRSPVAARTARAHLLCRCAAGAFHPSGAHRPGRVRRSQAAAATRRPRPSRSAAGARSRVAHELLQRLARHVAA